MHLLGQSPLGSIRRGLLGLLGSWALGLLGDRLGVRPIDKKATPISQATPKESPYAAGALRDTPSGLLPFQKLAVRGRTWMLILSPSKLVVSVKLYYTHPLLGKQSIVRHSHMLSGPFVVGAGASNDDIAVAAPWPRPSLPTKRSTQCELCIHTTDETDEKQPTLSRKQPQFKSLFGASPRPLQEASPRTPTSTSSSARPSFARPSLRDAIGDGSLRCQDLLVAPASLPRQPDPSCAACTAN